jgi:uncharacterized protein YceH (UPF0502 family)
VELTPQEGRVLGCLVEKQLTTPQLYPLTDNALIAACNQTTSRDPIVQYDLTTVRVAVRSLREQGLLRTVHRSGERTDKHQHELGSALDLAPEQVAVLGVLLLRGPQTAAELRARTERVHPFTSVEQVEQVLDGLAARDEPLVTRLPRQPGRREDRFAELLVGGTAAGRDDLAAGEAERGARPEAVPASGADLAGPQPQPPSGADLAAVAAEVARLRDEVAALRAEVAALRG